MRRPSHDDVEAAQRLSEPLLARRSAGGSGGGGPGSSSDVEQGGAAGPPSRGLSPDARSVDLHPAATPGGAFRLTKRTSKAQVGVTVPLAVGLHVMQAAQWGGVGKGCCVEPRSRNHLQILGMACWKAPPSVTPQPAPVPPRHLPRSKRLARKRRPLGMTSLAAWC